MGLTRLCPAVFLAGSRLFLKMLRKLARMVGQEGFLGKGHMSDTDLFSLVVGAQTGDRAAYDGIVRRF